MSSIYVIYVSSYYHICVLILLYMCPDTTIYAPPPQGVSDGGEVSRRILALIGGGIEERILPLGTQFTCVTSTKVRVPPSGRSRRGGGVTPHTSPHRGGH